MSAHEATAEGAATPGPQNILSKATLLSRERSSRETRVYHISSTRCPTCQSTSVKALGLQLEVFATCFLPQFPNFFTVPTIKHCWNCLQLCPLVLYGPQASGFLLISVFSLQLFGSLVGSAEGADAITHEVWEAHQYLPLTSDFPCCLGRVPHHPVLWVSPLQNLTAQEKPGQGRGGSEVGTETKRAGEWWQSCKEYVGDRRDAGRKAGQHQMELVQLVPERGTRWAAAFLQTGGRETCARRHKSRDV